MKKVVILHGMPEKHEYDGNEAGKNWIPWLKAALENKGYAVDTPEFPEPYEPNYEKWKVVFEKLTIDENTTLVGHSCGGGFLVRYLSENSIKVGKVFLVAPWLDPKNHLLSNFFVFEWDMRFNERTEGITVFVSLDDGQDVLTSVELISQRIPGVVLKQFMSKGHFTSEDMKKNEFSELLQEIIKD